MKRLLIRWLVLAAAIAIAVKIVPGVHLTSGLKSLLGVALVFGIINLVIGTAIRIVSLPIRILTVGLFSIVINAVLLELTSRADNVLTLNNFGTAIVAAVVISIATSILSAVVAIAS
jgi:putative membrane protein